VLAEPRRFLQVVAGPRQVGKSTLVQQVTGELGVPVRYVSADEPTLRSTDWIGQQWEAARLKATDKVRAVLVLDEIQKIPGWSETVKRLYEDMVRWIGGVFDPTGFDLNRLNRDWKAARARRSRG